MNLNKEWEAYTQEFDFLENAAVGTWQLYIWGKDNDGNIILDLSQKNIKRCEELYLTDENNINNLLRLWFLKTLVNQGSTELDEKVSKAKYEGEFAVISFFLDNIDRLDGFGNLEPHLFKFKNFFLDFIAKNRKHINNFFIDYSGFESVGGELEDILDILALRYITGYEPLCEHLDFIEISLKSSLELGDRAIDHIYATFAEYCYRNNLWIEAFCLYKILEIDREMGETKSEEVPVENLGIHTFLDSNREFKLTSEDIASRSEECLTKSILFDDSGKINQLVNQLFNYKFRSDEMIVALREKVYRDSKMYRIFKSVIEGNYSSAYELWDNWLERDEVEFFDLDPKQVSKYLRKQKNKVKQHNITKIHENIYVEGYAVLHDIEKKLKKFIFFNLKTAFGPRLRRWWGKGIPRDIREDAAKRHQSDLCSKIWEHLNFSDYIKIISKKDNWKNIFGQYFPNSISKKDKNGQVSFLREAVEIRNKIMHTRGGFKKKDLKRLKDIHKMFNIAYNSWAKTVKQSTKSEKDVA